MARVTCPVVLATALSAAAVGGAILLAVPSAAEVPKCPPPTYTGSFTVAGHRFTGCYGGLFVPCDPGPCDPPITAAAPQE